MKQVYILRGRVILLLLLFSALPAAYGQFILRGHVADAETGDPLSLANITLSDSGKGQISDSKGNFIFAKVPGRTDTLHIRYMGYHPQDIPVSFKDGDSLFVSVLLQPAVLPMPEISVAASRVFLERRLIEMDPTARVFTAKQLSSLPKVGFADIYRALQKQQGITQSNEASPQLYIRGGDMDQNLIMLDGAPIYYPFHFLGIGSSFNPDAIDGVSLSIGGFSSYFGNRLSSVIAFQSRQPEPGIHASANLQLIGADATLSGTITGKISWLASFRTSYFDLVQKLGVKQIPYSFEDGLFKLEYDPSPKQHAQFTLFKNRDNLNEDEKYKGILHSSSDSSETTYKRNVRDHLSWENHITSAQWDYRPVKKSEMHVTVFHSEYRNDYNKESFLQFPDNLNPKFADDKQRIVQENRDFNRENQTETNNRFYETGLKYSIDLSYNRWFWIAGVEHSRYNASYAWNRLYSELEKYRFRLFFDYAPDSVFHYDRSFQHTAGFLETTVRIADSLYVRPGMRMTRWNFITDNIFEPRFNVRYSRPDWQLTFAAGRFSQGISTSLEEGLIGFLELYFPVDAGNSIETANHYILDMTLKISPVTRLNAAAYYKTFSGLSKIIDGAPTFSQSTGKAWGLEVSLAAQWQGFDINGLYAWSRTRRTFNRISYDANSDQRHRVQFSVQKQLPGGADLFIYWEFHSGQPYWPGIYYGYIPEFPLPLTIPGRNETLYSAYEMDISRDRIRYPYYHRLDIQISITKRYKYMTMTPYFSLYNVYDRKNVLYYKRSFFTYDYINGRWENPHLERDPFTLPIIPSLGVKFEF